MHYVAIPSHTQIQKQTALYANASPPRFCSELVGVYDCNDAVNQKHYASGHYLLLNKFKSNHKISFPRRVKEH